MKLNKVNKMRSFELESADNLPIIGESGVNRNGLRVRSNAKASQSLSVLVPDYPDEDYQK